MEVLDYDPLVACNVNAPFLSPWNLIKSIILTIALEVNLSSPGLKVGPR